MSAAPREFAGLDLSHPRLMGIVNVTPDSFSDGGRHAGAAAAIDHGLALAAAGAAVLDVGGESTRPGAEPVPVEEEVRRVVPVVQALARAGHCVSVDTRRAAVMRAAIDAGARIVNDVTALTGDRDSLDVVAAARVAVVLMHMQGEPRTMQAAPRYDDVVAEVGAYLAARVDACRARGMRDADLCVDPGIGFGKTLEHNIALLRGLPRLRMPGVALLVGVSRKGFIGTLSGIAEPAARVAGSLAAGLAAIDGGADILRVHDVAETRQALDVWRGIGRPV
ncbi:MAG: dihydropteroate synthase [Alphaproteobacteria bacterium]|nr:dihydropteroate synthase [Alphaproteobacteria bacterium]